MKYQKLKIKYQKHILKIKYFLSIFDILYVFLIFDICYLIFFSFTGTVYAQSLALSVSPPIIEILIKPDKSITKEIKIMNLGEDAFVTAKLLQYPSDTTPSDSSYKPEAWITIPGQITWDQPFFLPKGEEKTMLLAVQPPPSTQEKDYYRILAFETKPITSLQYSASIIQQQLGIILFVSVSSDGLLSKNIEVTEFDLPKILDSFDPLRVKIRVKNTGNTYVRPNGTLTLLGLVGKARFEINPRILFPQQSQLLFTSTGEQQQSASTVLLRGFYLGKYTVDLGLRLDESSIKMKQTKTFYAFPWKGISILIVFIMIGALVIRVKGKNRKRI